MTIPRDLVSIDAIEAGQQVVARKSERDDNDKKEERDLTSRQRKAEIGVIEQQNADRKATRELRFLYAKAVYWYLCAYTATSGVLVLLAGFRPHGFQLPDIVLTTIVGTTAVAAIGLVGVVVGGLFKNSN